MTDDELIAAAILGLETELGRFLAGPENAQASRRVRGALVTIRSRLGQDLTLLDPEALTYVLAEILIARATNPEGFQSESIDDYTYRHGDETRRITILPEWWELLRPSTESAAFSTRPGFEPDGIQSSWITTTDQA